MLYDLKRMPRQNDAGGIDAARVGEELRDARLALGLSVDEMAARLRIRRAYLHALEEGRIGDLPAVAYAVGFVRSYAAALGLDADEMVRRFRDLAGAAAKARPTLVFPEPVPERGMPAGMVVVVGAVMAVGAYVAWFNWTGAGNRTVDAVPPVPTRLEQAAEQGRAHLPSRDTARNDAGALPLAALPPPGGMPPAPPVPAVPSITAGTTLPPTSTHGANTAAQAATVLAPPAPPVIAPAPPPPPATPVAVSIPGLPEGTRIALRARLGMPEGAWVHVRDPRSGQVLLNRVLRPGEAWAVPPRDGLVLDTGKADGLEIILDGQPTPVLDGLVGVRRNIVLEPERLRQHLVPAATASAAPAPGFSSTRPN